MSIEHLLLFDIFLKCCEMQIWPPKGLTIITCSRSNSAEFLLLGVATLQFCFMSWPWLSLKTMTVSRSNPFLTDQPRSPRIKDLTSKNIPWRITRLGHGRMQSIFVAIVVRKIELEESSGVPWVRKTLSPKPQQPFAVTPVPFLNLMIFAVDLRP